jgi:hypothetical protein
MFLFESLHDIQAVKKTSSPTNPTTPRTFQSNSHPHNYFHLKHIETFQSYQSSPTKPILKETQPSFSLSLALPKLPSSSPIAKKQNFPLLDV